MTVYIRQVSCKFINTTNILIMEFKVILVCAFFCMLQFHIGDAESIQLRVPADSIDGNSRFNTRIPYPVYRRGNYCSVCNNNCRSNRSFRLRTPKNPWTISVPSEKSKGGRLTITIDTKKSSTCDKAVPVETPADNGETSKQNVRVVVKLVPKNLTQEYPSTFTSGKSSATSNKYGNVLIANTDGTINIPGFDQLIKVSVLVNAKKSGKGPRKISLNSTIEVDNGNGKFSETNTQSEIKKTRENKSVPIDKPANPSEEHVGEPKPADKPLDTTPDPTSEDSSAPSDSSDLPVTGDALDPATSDDTESAPADTPTPGDSKTPEPVEAEPEQPTVSSGTASGAIADDETAATGSASGASVVPEPEQTQSTDDDKSSTSSDTTSEAIVDDETAATGSASAASGEPGSDHPESTDDNKSSASSGAATGAIADDKTAATDATSGVSADSG